MKKTVTLLMMLMAVALGLKAQDFSAVCSTGQTLYYEITSPTTVQVTGGENVSGVLEIPSSVTYEGTDYTVTRIGENAFYDNDYITEITIPEPITSIGPSAFAYCDNLLVINYNPINCPDVGYTGDNYWYFAFYSCSNLISINIGDQVQVIGTYAFYNTFSNLRDGLAIPNSVISVDYQAFVGTSYSSLSLGTGLETVGFGAFANNNTLTAIEYNCINANFESNSFEGSRGVTSVTFGENVEHIGSYAFYSFTNLTGSLSIPVSVTSIGECAFWGCSGLTGDLVIPNSVETIGVGAFSGCSNLDGTLTIGENVISVGYSAFNNCINLTTVYYNAINCTEFGWYRNDWGDLNGGAVFNNCPSLPTLVIGDQVQSIPERAFAGMSTLTGDLVIPNSVETIGDNAFSGCSNLGGTLTIGENVTSIGQYAFDYCTNLTTINYNAINCTQIGEWYDNGYGYFECYGNPAFSECTSLTTLNIGEEVVSIPKCAFYGISTFTGELTLPASIQNIGNYAFWGCSGFTGQLVFGTDAESVGYYAFYNCSGLSTLIYNATNCTQYGELVDEWGSRYVLPVFEGCTSLSTLVIGNGVQSIPERAFADVSTFTGDLIIPESVRSIGNAAFMNCTGFNGNLVIGNGVKNISNEAFRNCTGFTGTWNIPNSVETIGSYCFQNCSGISGTLVLGENLISVGEKAFSNCPGITAVAFNAINCQTMGNWNSVFSGNSTTATLTIGEGVQRIPDYAFYGYYGLTGTIEFPNSVKYIGTSSFSGCNGLLGTLVLNENIESFGNSAFANCSGITSVVFNTINCQQMRYVFEGCSSLNTVSFGEHVRVIPDLAFKECTFLSQVLTLPESLESIGAEAFYGCSGLYGDLIIPNSVSSINAYAFCGCYGLNSNLTIPESVSFIGYGAFEWCGGIKSLNYNAVNCNVEGGLAAGFLSLTTLNIGPNVQRIPDNAFPDCSSLTGDLIIPDATTYIGEKAFYNCYNFNGELHLGNSIETIGNEAFYNCGGFRGEITIPETTTSIGTFAFRGCDEISGVNYNAINCAEMGNSTSPVFYDCVSIETINIGDRVTAIPNYAFKRCSNVTSMSVGAMNPPVIGSSSFGTVSRNIPVTVQCGSLLSYQEANYWNEFNNYQEDFNYVLNVMTNDEEQGQAVVTKMPTCDDLYATVQAWPESGFAFVNWTENGEVISNANPFTFQMTSSHNLQANFAEGVSYSIETTANPLAGGMITGAGNYNGGAQVTLTATANEGYNFVNWTENGTVLSVNPTYVLTASSNHSLTANFTSSQYHWMANPNQYPENMSVMGIVRIDGVEQRSATLEIGAFCGEECRGSQMLTYYPQVDRYMAFLTIFGENDDEISFRLYDHAIEEESALSCMSTLVFADNAIVGNPLNPYMFDFANAQTASLPDGWTWYSTHIEQSAIDGLSIMETSLGDNGIMIKSQSDGFVMNSNGDWMGTLSEIDNEQTYLINTAASCVMTLFGANADPAAHPIDLNQGWTWIGYPNANAMEINAALSSLTPTDGDVLKAQQCFSTYIDGFGWFGTLNTLQPGMGLRYFASNETAQTLTYPTAARNNSVPKNITSEQNHWTVNASAYPNNMTVTASVELDGFELADENYELAAFANGNCRGSARLMYVAAQDRYMAFLTVNGEDVETLSFKLYDVESQSEVGYTDNTLMFAPDAIVGMVKEPYVIRFGATTNVEEARLISASIFPNPSENGARVKLSLQNATGTNQVEIMDALGQIMSKTSFAGSEVELTVPTVSGIYLIRIITDTNSVILDKLIVK